MVTTATCYRCKQTVALTEMKRDARKAGGYARICRSCDRARSREYYADPINRAKKLAYEAKRKAEREAPPARAITCKTCAATVCPAHPRQQYCKSCAAERSARRERIRKYDAEAERIKWMKRRAATALTDVDPAWLVDLRANAKACPLCKVKLTTRPDQPNSRHVDHIVPLYAGGAHTRDNLRVICRTCNLTRPRDLADLAGMQISLTMVDANASENVVDLDAKRGAQERKALVAAAKKFANYNRREGNLALGLAAARARAKGTRWEDVTTLLPHTDNTGTAYQLANAAATTPEIQGRSGRRRAA